VLWLSKEERDEMLTIYGGLDELNFAKPMPFAFTEHGFSMLSGLCTEIGPSRHLYIILHSEF
jgi:hypothetical protein